MSACTPVSENSRMRVFNLESHLVLYRLLAVGKAEFRKKISFINREIVLSRDSANLSLFLQTCFADMSYGVSCLSP